MLSHNKIIVTTIVNKTKSHAHALINEIYKKLYLYPKLMPFVHSYKFIRLTEITFKLLRDFKLWIMATQFKELNN